MIPIQKTPEGTLASRLLIQLQVTFLSPSSFFFFFPAYSRNSFFSFPSEEPWEGDVELTEVSFFLFFLRIIFFNVPMAGGGGAMDVRAGALKSMDCPELALQEL